VFTSFKQAKKFFKVFLFWVFRVGVEGKSNKEENFFNLFLMGFFFSFCMCMFILGFFPYPIFYK